MFPHVKYMVTTDGSVMAIIQQCLAEWHSSIGPTAICIIIDFFSKLDDDMNIIATVEGLLEDYTFLCETPGKPSSEGMFCSPFLIELLGTAHLNNIMGYVDIPQLSMRELAAGKDMVGMIGMASAAKLEHAVKYIMEGIIDVDKVLTDMMEAGDGKIQIQASESAQQSYWQEHIHVLQFFMVKLGDLIVKCGPEWLHATLKAAHSMTTDDHAMEGVNPHALLCSFWPAAYSFLQPILL
ncbi:hypothetical protein EDD16DRAFT_1521946 [Pisolithus croceorrhizus]|nr:hypothetical protein EDD16DRAFT_1521946 [Pisolithus croceorrhizus]KAI6119281.1 hypothetical protein EV401DRAFT_1888267 [Pisolithus croceorrhizus]KAI6165118.1 hypothetical protein EDD17DRAFT_1506001 [Pisolithus thermaeus]